MSISTPLASGGVSKSAKVGGIYSISFSLNHKTIFTGNNLFHKTNTLFTLISGTESGDIVGWNLEQFFKQSDMKPHDPKKKQSSIFLEDKAYSSTT